MYPELTTEEAYAAQLIDIGQKVKDGQRVVGKKIGLTSVAMQQLLGVDQPDYGHLLDSMEVRKHGIVPMDQLFQPKVEGELAFVLKEDLTGPNVTLEDVLDATDYIVPSIEIVDSRLQTGKLNGKTQLLTMLPAVCSSWETKNSQRVSWI